MNRWKISGIVENHLLACAVRFCYCLFVCFFFPSFFVNMLFFTKFCWNLTNIPFGMLVHFFLLKFLFCSLCSLSILRFSYVSARFLNNINKNKKCSIVLNLLNLVKKALSVWEKDNKNANLGKKSTEGNLFIVVCT